MLQLCPRKINETFPNTQELPILELHKSILDRIAVD